MIGITIVSPTVEFITPKYFPNWAEASPLLVEECGRVSHKSEGRIAPGSAEPFIKRIAMGMGHESIIEHVNFTACFIGSRAMSHQLVRHRLASYTQESQRYCDYGHGHQDHKLLQVIMPPSIMKSANGLSSIDTLLWGKTIVEGGPSGNNLVVLDSKATLQLFLEEAFNRVHRLDTVQIPKTIKWVRKKIDTYLYYLEMRENGIPAEDARYDLPNATKTEVYSTYNIREWRHFFKMRCDKHAQWEIRMLATMAFNFLSHHIPVFFEDQQYGVDA